MRSRHEAYEATVRMTPAVLFERLDDQTRLSAHMSKRSWKMGWGKMDTILDAQSGRAVGSHIILRGRVFGIRLALDEVITLREPPMQKQWETVGEPRLLVIGPYRMGFTITPREQGFSALRVFIDYDLPSRGVSRWLGKLFGAPYARWCVTRMVTDASGEA